MQQQTKPLLWLLSLSSLIIMSSCHNYYKAVSGRTGAYTSNTIDSLKNQSRFFVLRNDSQAFRMNNIVVSADKKSLSCQLDTLPPEHKLHLKGGHRGNLQYKKSNGNEAQVLNEVHLYTAGAGYITSAEKFHLAFDQLQKMEIIKKDKGRTTESHVLGALGYTLGVALVIGIIVGGSGSTGAFNFHL